MNEEKEQIPLLVSLDSY